VFFDNLQVSHIKGTVLEETHYYPFGLVMAGISAKGVGKVENKYKFNGIEHTKELDLNQYDAFFRNLDPQIGRFWQLDPTTTHWESPYVTMQNNPISKTDWLGDFFTFSNDALQMRYNQMRETNNQNLKNNIEELSSMDLNSEDKKVQKRIEELAYIIDKQNTFNTQLDEMENSLAEFAITDEKPSSLSSQGDTRYDIGRNAIIIRLGKSNPSFSILSHEIRHGYGYLIGELIGGADNGSYDISDEVEAYKTSNIFDKSGAEKDGLKFEISGQYTIDYFNKHACGEGGYSYLKNKTTAISVNTLAAAYMKNNPNDRISFILGANKSNANMTVGQAVEILNAHAIKNYGKPAYYFGQYLNKK
jgi:RHS repeat-associated protein